MNLYVLYKYHNYGRIGESKEVMAVCTDMSIAHRLATKYSWSQEKVEANKVRVDGGCFSPDRWKDDSK